MVKLSASILNQLNKIKGSASMPVQAPQLGNLQNGINVCTDLFANSKTNAIGIDPRYPRYNIAKQAPKIFNDVINLSGIGSLTGNATNTFDTYSSVYINAALNENILEEERINYIKVLLSTINKGTSITVDGKEYQIGDPSNTMKYKPAPRINNHIIMSNSVARRTFMMMYMCSFTNLSDLLLLLEDIDAIGRFYQESIIDSVKTAKTIFTDFLLRNETSDADKFTAKKDNKTKKTGYIKAKPMELCKIYLERKLNNEEDRDKHVNPNTNVPYDYKYEDKRDTPKEAKNPNNTVKAIPTVNSSIQDQIVRNKIIPLLELLDSYNTVPSTLVDAKYANVPAYREFGEFNKLASQAKAICAIEVEDLELDDPKVKIAKAKANAVKSLIGDTMRCYIRRNETFSREEELIARSIFIAIAGCLVTWTGYGKNRVYSLGTELKNTSIIDCLDYELKTFCLTINLKESLNPNRRIQNMFYIKYDIVANRNVDLSIYDGCQAFVSNRNGVCIGVMVNSNGNAEKFTVLDNKMTRQGSTSVGTIKNGKLLIAKEIVKPEYEDDLYLVRMSATGDIVDIDGNIIKVKKVLYNTIKDEDDADFKNPNKNRFIVKGKVVKAATEEQLAYVHYVKEEEISDEDLDKEI